MKKLISTLLVFVAFICIQAASLSNVAVDAVYESGLEVSVNSSGVYDSLQAADTVNFQVKFSPKPTQQYILTLGPLSGVGDDSISIALELVCYDVNDSVIYTVLTGDTILTAAATKGYQCIIPFREIAVANKYTVRGVTTTAHSQVGQVYINEVALYTRRPIGVDQSWATGR
jgi:hypothetical protein